ncbi:beta family protein [Terasakiella sp.]|uniref:beta family protein n=1 Tax=Terasakiella sp. TaxID=2034861 RepID=UPI003AA8DEA0
MTKIPHQTYFPILKWKAGEYRALRKLDSKTKARTLPLITLTPIDFDFEGQRQVKTIDEHLGNFADRLMDHWGPGRILIDLREEIENEIMADGRPVVTFIFEEIAKQGSYAVPVFGFRRSRGHAELIRNVVLKNKDGICLRVPLEEMLEDNFSKQLQNTLDFFEVLDTEVDFILDLEAPETFEPYEDLAGLIATSLSELEGVDNFRSVAIVSSSFPESITSVIAPPGGDIVRHEWHLYKKILGLLEPDDRVPSFGDYGIEHPQFINMDMRFVKPSGKLIYTYADKWHVRRGPNVRDNKYEQYVDHSAAIVKDSSIFAGAFYSEGDQYIAECATGRGKTGQLTVWKWVGINHHITHVVEELSNLNEKKSTV